MSRPPDGGDDDGFIQGDNSGGVGDDNATAVDGDDDVGGGGAVVTVDTSQPFVQSPSKLLEPLLQVMALQVLESEQLVQVPPVKIGQVASQTARTSRKKLTKPSCVT